jgi:hypothetical protein
MALDRGGLSFFAQHRFHSRDRPPEPPAAA